MYEFAIIRAPSEGRASHLENAVSSEADRLDIRVDPVDFSRVSGAPRVATVIVYLGSQNARTDDGCMAQVQQALSLNLPIIVVVEETSERTEQIPKELEYIKAISWSEGDEAPRELVTTVFEVLGITEKERRIFISYRHSDAANIAIQLHQALAERRFIVFLDQFQTSAPENIQDRIDEALEDMAFMLLLHSPDMPDSQWIDWEITRALKSRLPILVVRWADATDVIEKLKYANFPVVGFDPENDVTSGMIRNAKLGEILGKVEEHHAEGLFRRRKESITAAKLFAESRGWEVVEEPRWKLMLTKPSGGVTPIILGVTPRIASGEDLHELDDWETPPSSAIGVTWRRVLFQASAELPGPRRRFLEWIVEGKNIQGGGIQISPGANALSLLI